MELEPSLTLSLFFGLGVVARSLLMLDSLSIRKNKLGIIVSLGAIPITFLIGMAKIPDWSPYLHLFIALAVYCMTFALIMKKTILPGVNEVTLLFLNIISGMPSSHTGILSRVFCWCPCFRYLSP